MNSPVVWIFIPGVIAIILYMLRGYTRIVKILGLFVALLLALLAWLLPIGTPISLGVWPSFPSFTISDRLTLLGRSLILTENARIVLVIIYFGAALWFIGASVINISRLFVPLSLAIAALLTAAISVEPFLYAALFIELAVLLCIPILSPPGQPISRGVLRFLTFQTIGMFLLLLASWMVYSVELSANNPVIALRATGILSLGLAMTLAIFPFSAWIPMITGDSHPFATSYVLFILPEIITLFALNLFSRYSWLQSSQATVLWFSIIGLIMVVGGGVLAIYQKNLGRIYGYAVITEIGLIVISIGQISSTALPMNQTEGSLVTLVPLAMFLFALILPRGLNLAIWALGLSIIKNITRQLEIESLRGVGYQLPVASIGITLACFSLAGYPLLAGFPVRAALSAGMVELSPFTAGAALFGYFGLVIAALKSLFILLDRQHSSTWKIGETIPQVFLLSLGIVVLILVGVFPQLFLLGIQNIIP